MFKYQFKSGKYFAGLIKSAELFLKSRFEGLEEFGLYALRTSHRLVCSATNHHCSQRKHRSSGVFYRFAPAWVQVPKIHTIKKPPYKEVFLWCRLRDLGSSVCMPRALRIGLFARRQTITAHNENTGAAVFSIGSRLLGFKSQKFIP